MSLNPLPVAPPKIVAIAKDTNVKPEHASEDKDLPGTPPKYGQDFTFAVGRTAPGGEDVGGAPPGFVGSTEDVLKMRMEKLLRIFATGDEKKMARRLFDKFLSKRNRVYYFEDKDLNAAAEAHENIRSFCSKALGAPPPFGISPAPGTTRIHQALKAAGWDLAQLVAPTDLGVPAFNKGNKARKTEDFDNGLGLMINGVQHAYVIATGFAYDAAGGMYCIALRYIFYDVFGLDDDDLKEYGAKSDGWLSSDAAVGITAWWQLQHQFGYAPLVTRIVVERTFTMPAL